MLPTRNAPFERDRGLAVYRPRQRHEDAVNMPLIHRCLGMHDKSRLIKALWLQVRFGSDSADRLCRRGVVSKEGRMLDTYGQMTDSVRAVCG